MAPKLQNSLSVILIFMGLLAVSACKPQNPDNGDLVNKHLNEKRYDLAIDVIVKAHGQNPDDPEMKYLLRDAYAGASGLSLVQLADFFEVEEKEGKETPFATRSPKLTIRKILKTI